MTPASRTTNQYGTFVAKTDDPKFPCQGCAGMEDSRICAELPPCHVDLPYGPVIYKRIRSSKRIKIALCFDCVYQNKSIIGKACTIGHNPRFYHPRNGNPHDEKSGYKRKCADFKPVAL